MEVSSRQQDLCSVDIYNSAFQICSISSGRKQWALLPPQILQGYQKKQCFNIFFLWLLYYVTVVCVLPAMCSVLRFCNKTSKQEYCGFLTQDKIRIIANQSDKHFKSSVAAHKLNVKKFLLCESTVTLNRKLFRVH